MSQPNPTSARRFPTTPRSEDWIRSFHGRPGRMSERLTQIWTEGGPEVMPDTAWGLGTQLAVLDVGCGMGHSTIAMAADRPEALVIGVDVHEPGLARVIRDAREAQLTNVRVWCGDSLTALSQLVPEASLSLITVWFPDPWPKRTQQKRRLVRPLFVRLAARALVTGGELRVATDNADYASHVQRVVRQNTDFQPLGDHGVVPRPKWRPLTKYERKASEPITDLAFRRQ